MGAHDNLDHNPSSTTSVSSFTEVVSVSVPVPLKSGPGQSEELSQLGGRPSNSENLLSASEKPL